jgi:hypothetical protein
MLGISPESDTASAEAPQPPQPGALPEPPRQPEPNQLPPPPWALGYGGQAAPPPAPYTGVPADVPPTPVDPRSPNGAWEHPAGFPEAAARPAWDRDTDMDPGHGRPPGVDDTTRRRPEPPREDNVIMLDVQDGPVGARVVER